MSREIGTFAIFCGSNAGGHEAYAEGAKALGRALGSRGICIVYGGTHKGLMGYVADAALAAGGRVHGVITERLHGRGHAHAGLSALEIMPTLRARKERMAALADAFNLRGTPTIIVHGRADARVPIGFTSRPFLGLNALSDPASNLRLYELANVEHFNAGLPGHKTSFVPITPYLWRSLDLIHDHLSRGTPLPPSQLVRSAVAAGGPGKAGQGLQLPPVRDNVGVADRIEVSGGRVVVPE